MDLEGSYKYEIYKVFSEPKTRRTSYDPHTRDFSYVTLPRDYDLCLVSIEFRLATLLRLRNECITEGWFISVYITKA